MIACFSDLNMEVEMRSKKKRFHLLRNKPSNAFPGPYTKPVTAKLTKLLNLVIKQVLFGYFTRENEETNYLKFFIVSVCILIKNRYIQSHQMQLVLMYITVCFVD